jgi:hypothetical protein
LNLPFQTWGLKLYLGAQTSPFLECADLSALLVSRGLSRLGLFDYDWDMGDRPPKTKALTGQRAPKVELPALPV